MPMPFPSVCANEKNAAQGEIKRIKVRFFATMLKTMALTAALQDEMSEMLKKNNEIVALQSRLRSSTDANSSLRKTCVNLHQRRVVACGDMAERLRDAEKRAQATAEELNAAEVSVRFSVLRSARLMTGRRCRRPTSAPRTASSRSCRRPTRTSAQRSRAR